MTYCAERTKLLAKAGRETAERLLPKPFALWYSNHDTGCQMTIIAPGAGGSFDFCSALKVWKGSIWYSSVYEFNDRDAIPGLQPDFEFARATIDSFFNAVQAEVDKRDQARAKQKTVQELTAASNKVAAIDAVRRALGA